MFRMLHVGLDDTDSERGMCTTYLGAVLMQRLRGVAEVAEARLVRLNPNIKYKTRGNAAVALRLITSRPEVVKSITLRTVEELADMRSPSTAPGVVFWQGEVPESFREFYRRCLHGVVGIGEAEEVLHRHGGEYVKFKLGRGIVGALAAIGAELRERTYEYIAYRSPERWGTPRRVCTESVRWMNRLTYPLTFNNLDEEGRVLITPHTPCPVLFGIRGVSEQVVREAAGMVVALEPVVLHAVYVSNQATDAHLREVGRIAEVEPLSSVVLLGRVASEPRVIEGGHVFFRLRDEHGDEITCAAFEPTKGFRRVVRALLPGDLVRVYGGVNERMQVNLEKIEVIELLTRREVNPRCGRCGRRMKSAGRGQGYRCRRCGTRAERRVSEPVERTIEERMYQVPPGAMRHLARPLVLGEPAIPESFL